MVRPKEIPARQRLATRLEELGLSQADLGTRLAVSPASVSRWLSGERTPLLEMAFLIQRQFGIPADSWIEACHG